MDSSREMGVANRTVRALIGVIDSSRDTGVSNRTVRLGVTKSLRAGFLVIGVSLGLDLSSVDPVTAVDFGVDEDTASSSLFDDEATVAACFFAMVAHFSTLPAATMVPGSSSSVEANANSLGLYMRGLTVACRYICVCVSVPLLATILKFPRV